MSLAALSFLNSTNADFIADLVERYAADPASVDPSWRAFFTELNDDPNVLRHEKRGVPTAANPTPAQPVTTRILEAPAVTSSPTALLDSIRAIMLIRATRVCGHLLAKLDPLGLVPPQPHPELDPRTYGFSEADYDRPIFIDGMLGLETATLRQITDILHRTYCGSIGVEFMHIQDPAQKFWIQERFERTQSTPVFDKPFRRALLERLTAAESFEKFLEVKFTATKRFGLEGAETMIPALEALITRCAEQGLREVVVGMAHRGRLNVLTNIIQKPFTAMFAEFQGVLAYPESVQGSGDVKYHMGASVDRDFGGKQIHLTMSANPSHLEFVNPVVVGRVRAKQQASAKNIHISEESTRRVMGLLIHGDAAFAGQGVVAETLMLSELKGYRTGGTMHFVINNQIGFTTYPKYSRSGVYCTDVAKMIQAPILHVNGDDVEAVVHVAQIAAEFRQKFNKDIVIDMVCYRRQGHNESDEPSFTQPLMYQKIDAHPTTRTLYAAKLVAEGVVTQAEADEIKQRFLDQMEKDFRAATAYQPSKAHWLEGKWASIEVASGEERSGTTGVDPSVLRKVGEALTTIPEGFGINSKIAKQLEAKRAMMTSGEGIDWATAEALAFGTLVTDGFSVRLSGQDCRRGTFSQRHAAIYDQTNGQRHIALNTLNTDKAHFEVHDSPLSELAVMGFDYGFSLVDPNVLVLWEGQFGDFANSAQVIIDQFISAAESKWLRMSGLTLLLPHGYEGQGPEHSSARLERYLQLCAEDNMQVANCSTPANYFHILRRQMKRSFRKPLILITPKSLLRHKMAVSKLAEMEIGSTFQRVIGETETNLLEDRLINRVVLCSGKVYYDLLAKRQELGLKDVALVRIEQFYPFPARPLEQILLRYPRASIFWCQEEPQNMGAWTFLDRKIEAVLATIGHGSRRPTYVGRRESAATACGSLKQHNREQAELVNKALTGL